jgi:hypothetical protein
MKKLLFQVIARTPHLMRGTKQSLSPRYFSAEIRAGEPQEKEI